ncbi:8066_t:CDS:2, partial [Cetraspora pellucida]
MLRILSKIIVRERVSCKANALPKDIIAQYLQGSENLKNLRLYGLVVGALTRSRQKKFQIKFESIGDGLLIVDIRAGNLRHEKQVTLSSEVAEQSTIHTKLLESSENSLDEEDYASDASNVSEVDLTTTSIWKEQPITIDQRAIQLTYNRPCQINLPSVRLWVLMSIVPVSDRRYYWRTQENTQPLMSFNFQRWMNRKPQCIIATASTTANADEVRHVVKNNTSSEIVKFTRPKVFYEYSQAKGAHEEAHNLSHFDFRRRLADEMLGIDYN